jgi:cysteine synthase
VAEFLNDRRCGAETSARNTSCDYFRPVSQRSCHFNALAFLTQLTDKFDTPKVNNPLAHEYTTGPEIINAVVSTPSTSSKPSSGTVDAFIAGAGTGGTVTGVSRALKKTHNSKCIVVGVDPVCFLLFLYLHHIYLFT